MPYSKQNPTLELAQSFLDSLVSLARRGFLLCGSRADSVDILCVRGALLRSSRVAIATCPVDCRTSYSFLCCTLVLLKRLARVFESIQVKQRQDARLKRSVVVGWLSCSKAISTVGGGERRLKKKRWWRAQTCLCLLKYARCGLQNGDCRSRSKTEVRPHQCVNLSYRSYDINLSYRSYGS